MSRILSLCLAAHFSAGLLSAAPPELFSTWAKTGPQFPGVPEGWQEELPRSSGTALQPSEEEQKLGFVVFARDYAAPVGPHDVPLAAERVSEVRAFAAQGEYEPISFGVHALSNIKSLSLGVGEFRSPGGAIAPPQVDVRWVRCVRQITNKKEKLYRLTPFLLESRPAIALARGTNAQAWITVKVPDDASPGVYEAEGKLSADANSQSVSLKLRVLPFALPVPTAEMAMSVRAVKDDEALRGNMIDLREHGIWGSQTIASAHVASRDRKFGPDDVEATVKGAERSMRLYREVFGRAPERFKFGIGHQIIYYWNHEKFWFSFWPYQKEDEEPEDAEDEAERMVHQEARRTKEDFVKAGKLMADLARKNQWGEPWAYVIDEPGGHSHIADAVFWNSFLKESVPGTKTHVCIGGGIAQGMDEIGQLTPAIDFFLLNRFSPTIYQSLVQHKRADAYGVYNGGSSAERIGAFVRDRFFFGLYGFRTGAREILQWVYQFGKPFEEPFRGNHGYSYQTPDGPLPSIAQQCVREGIDDYGYVQLLWSMIAAAGKSPGGTAKAAAETATTELSDIMRRTGMSYQAVYARRPPPVPAELRNWRWLIASHILALSEHVKAESVPPTRPPAPIHWPDDQTRDEPLLGDEIVPKGDFEGPDDKAWGPWAVQVWGGKGNSALDNTQAHSGEQCVRVTNTEKGGPEKPAVSVLVWASWRMPKGKPSINMILEAGHSYMLSAWVKGKGGFLPTLRIASKGGQVKTKTELGDKVDGWQELKLVAEVQKSAQVGYLCVWVLGSPATVWVDDLSFREIRKPALELQMRRHLFTDADRSATIELKANEESADVEISITDSTTGKSKSLRFPTTRRYLVSEEAGMRAETVVTGQEFTVTFDPGSYPVGEHTVRARLLGTDAPELQAKFRRIAGPFAGR